MLSRLVGIFLAVFVGLSVVSPGFAFGATSSTGGLSFRSSKSTKAGGGGSSGTILVNDLFATWGQSRGGVNKDANYSGGAITINSFQRLAAICGQGLDNATARGATATREQQDSLLAVDIGNGEKIYVDPSSFPFGANVCELNAYLEGPHSAEREVRNGYLNKEIKFSSSVTGTTKKVLRTIVDHFAFTNRCAWTVKFYRLERNGKICGGGYDQVHSLPPELVGTNSNGVIAGVPTGLVVAVYQSEPIPYKIKSYDEGDQSVNFIYPDLSRIQFKKGGVIFSRLPMQEGRVIRWPDYSNRLVDPFWGKAGNGGNRGALIEYPYGLSYINEIVHGSPLYSACGDDRCLDVANIRSAFRGKSDQFKLPYTSEQRERALKGNTKNPWWEFGSHGLLDFKASPNNPSKPIDSIASQLGERSARGAWLRVMSVTQVYLQAAAYAVCGADAEEHIYTPTVTFSPRRDAKTNFTNWCRPERSEFYANIVAKLVQSDYLKRVANQRNGWPDTPPAIRIDDDGGKATITWKENSWRRALTMIGAPYLGIDWENYLDTQVIKSRKKAKKHTVQTDGSLSYFARVPLNRVWIVVLGVIDSRETVLKQTVSVIIPRLTAGAMKEKVSTPESFVDTSAFNPASTPQLPTFIANDTGQKLAGSSSGYNVGGVASFGEAGANEGDLGSGGLEMVVNMPERSLSFIRGSVAGTASDSYARGAGNKGSGSIANNLLALRSVDQANAGAYTQNSLGQIRSLDSDYARALLGLQEVYGFGLSDRNRFAAVPLIQGALLPGGQALQPGLNDSPMGFLAFVRFAERNASALESELVARSARNQDDVVNNMIRLRKYRTTRDVAALVSFETISSEARPFLRGRIRDAQNNINYNYDTGTPPKNVFDPEVQQRLSDNKVFYRNWPLGINQRADLDDTGTYVDIDTELSFVQWTADRCDRGRGSYGFSGLSQWVKGDVLPRVYRVDQRSDNTLITGHKQLLSLDDLGAPDFSDLVDENKNFSCNTELRIGDPDYGPTMRSLYRVPSFTNNTNGTVYIPLVVRFNQLGDFGLSDLAASINPQNNEHVPAWAHPAGVRILSQAREDYFKKLRYQAIPMDGPGEAHITFDIPQSIERFVYALQVSPASRWVENSLDANKIDQQYQYRSVWVSYYSSPNDSYELSINRDTANKRTLLTGNLCLPYRYYYKGKIHIHRGWKGNIKDRYYDMPGPVLVDPPIFSDGTSLDQHPVSDIHELLTKKRPWWNKQGIDLNPDQITIEEKRTITVTITDKNGRKRKVRRTITVKKTQKVEQKEYTVIITRKTCSLGGASRPNMQWVYDDEYVKGGISQAAKELRKRLQEQNLLPNAGANALPRGDYVAILWLKVEPGDQFPDVDRWGMYSALQWPTATAQQLWIDSFVRRYDPDLAREMKSRIKVPYPIIGAGEFFNPQQFAIKRPRFAQ